MVKQRYSNAVSTGYVIELYVWSALASDLLQLRSFRLLDRWIRCLKIRLKPLNVLSRRCNVSLRRSVEVMSFWAVFSMTLCSVVLTALNLLKRKTKSVFLTSGRCATRKCTYFLSNSDFKSSFDRYKVNTLWCEFTMHYVACKD